MGVAIYNDTSYHTVLKAVGFFYHTLPNSVVVEMYFPFKHFVVIDSWDKFQRYAADKDMRIEGEDPIEKEVLETTMSVAEMLRQANEVEE